MAAAISAEDISAIRLPGMAGGRRRTGVAQAKGVRTWKALVEQYGLAWVKSNMEDVLSCLTTFDEDRAVARLNSLRKQFFRYAKGQVSGSTKH